MVKKIIKKGSKYFKRLSKPMTIKEFNIFKKYIAKERRGEDYIITREKGKYYFYLRFETPQEIVKRFENIGKKIKNKTATFRDVYG